MRKIRQMGYAQSHRVGDTEIGKAPEDLLGALFLFLNSFVR
jgi:hypothetical protein